MKNQFFEKNTEDNIKEIGELFCIRDAVFALDANDVKDIMTGADNAIVLYGQGYGKQPPRQCPRGCCVAEGVDLFSADKVLLYIVCPKSHPMLMSENETTSTFLEIFPHATEWRWGLAERENINEMRIMIVASNLHKKS